MQGKRPVPITPLCLGHEVESVTSACTQLKISCLLFTVKLCESDSDVAKGQNKMV